MASERVALKVGFIEQSIKNGRHEYLLESSLYPKERNFRPEIPGIPADRIKALRKKIYFISRLLAIVQSEIEMNLGDPDYSENLREVVNQVYRQIWELEDSWSDRQ